MKTHLKYLDGLRAVAALAVLVHHAYLNIPQALMAQLAHSPLRFVLKWLMYGHFAVDLFIVLSGFCLMLPVLRNDDVLKGGALQFFFKRARRILPPYYFAIALSLLLIHFFVGKPTGTHWDISLPVTKRGLIYHLLLLHDIFSAEGLQINHSFWSIAVEWHIYFLFPLLIYCWKRFGASRTTMVALALSAVALVLLAKTPYSAVNPTYYGIFVLGALAATIAYRRDGLWHTIRERFPWWLAFAASAATVAVYCINQDFNTMSANFGYLDYVAGFSIFFFLVAVSIPVRDSSGELIPNRVARALSVRPLAFIGTFAYSLYLVHAPLLQVVWQYIILPGGHHAFGALCLMIFVGSPLIIGVAYLFFLCCERPFLSAGAKAASRNAEKRLHESV